MGLGGMCPNIERGFGGACVETESGGLRRHAGKEHPPPASSGARRKVRRGACRKEGACFHFWTAARGLGRLRPRMPGKRGGRWLGSES
eukprot:scaffold9406_cov149-Isochrysis_galbana.AAC.1